MADPNAFAKLVPGFDFLQGLMGGAAPAVPGMSSWVAPTLDPAELDKRIDELRTVQFWLEQNARLIATTIQALEVQRMTLGTLRQMNMSIGDMAKAMQLPVPDAAPAPAVKAADRTPSPSSSPSSSPSHAPSSSPAAASPPAAAGVVDPMQWWSALTQQFTALAAKAVRESSAEGHAGSSRRASSSPRAAEAAAGTPAASTRRPAARKKKAATKTPPAPARSR
jgi:hypothetical protein